MARSSLMLSLVHALRAVPSAALVFVATAVLFALFPTQGHAQQPDYEQQGLTFYGSYQGGNVDTVNMRNGNVMINIPLVSFPQRGNLSLSYSLSLNNSGFYYVKTCDVQGQCTGTWKRQFPSPSIDTIGPSLVMDQGLNLYQSLQSVHVGGTQGTTYYYYLYTLMDSTGAQHPLGFDNSNLSNLRATDGSGYLAVASGGECLRLPSGSERFFHGVFTKRNKVQLFKSRGWRGRCAT
ncbi:MAG: hypothetical protein WAN65_02500 [Candidatus Sulfotelmatobacter sp.]